MTFHGRDIMGPVAAHIASGVPVTRLGPPLELDGIARLELPSPARVDESGAIVGSVLYTDQFGNIITNINEEAFGHLQVNVSTRFSIVVNSNTPSGCFKEARFTQVYADVPEKEALCLFNSENRFEIAINKGSAAAFFGNPAPRSTVLVRKIG